MRLAVSRLVVIAALVLVCEGGVAQKSAATAVSSDKKTAANPATKKVTAQDQRREIIFNILEEVHAAAEELPTEQRVAILKDICGTAFDLGDYRFPAVIHEVRGATRAVKPERFGSKAQIKQLKDWSEELYQAANELPQGSYTKLEAQSVAVRMMAPVDDKRALDMLDGLDASDSQGAEEQKKYLAMSVYSAMLERKGDAVVPELRARAQALGENGQYPYYAMKAVADRIADKELVRSIFNDALSSFQHSEDKLNSMFGMLSLLQDGEIRPSLYPWQVHEAALQIANRLKREIERDQKAYDDGKATRPGLSLIADSVRSGLKDIDPDLASTVPELPPYTAARAQKTLGDDAPAAKLSAEARKLRSDFEKTSTSLMEMSEDEVHGGPELRQVIERGVDQASELLRASTADAKDHVVALQTAMAPVTDFVQVGARTNPAMTLAAVRKVQDSEIRARMLLVIAEGLPSPGRN